MPKIGFALSHEQFPAPELIELGIAAEQAGFDCLWTSDHFHPWMDNQGHGGQAWVTLAALGQRTSIPFGTGVTCPTYRYHPAIVAQAFASLGVLYPGRVFLGTGTGEALNEQPVTGEWGAWQERADRIEEATDVIRRLWTGEWTSVRGRYYTVENARLYDLPSQPVPIYMSGTGPKSAEIAGRISDGLVSSAESVVKPEIRNAWERGVRAAGKDPSRQEVLAELQVVVGGQAEAEEAARMWQFQPKAWSDYVNDPDPRDIARRAAAEVPLDQMVQKIVVGADAEPHVKKLVETFRGGATQIYVHSGQHDQQRVIDFYGREVIPAVKRELGVARAA